MIKHLLVVAASLLVLLPTTTRAADYHVSPTGSDTASGTPSAPFQTIQRAADQMTAGDTCHVHGGTYRETVRMTGTSGLPGRPIRFLAVEGEKVVLDGTEPIRAEWSVHEGNIYRAAVPQRFVQLFVDRQMMIEARWPNMRFDQSLDRDCWAKATEGSAYRKIVCEELGETRIDWTGALATLNIGHQFWSWTRDVEKHEKGSDLLVYPEVPGLERFHDRPYAWADDYFYLSGKLEALDSPTEWFLDRSTGTLYLHADDSQTPADRQIEFKKRDYGFELHDCDHVEIVGFHFFATTFHFTKADHCLAEDCRLLFPTHARRVREDDRSGKPASTLIQGNHNTIRKVGLAHASNAGLVMSGGHNLLENCIVHDINWVGTLSYPAVRISPDDDQDEGNVIRRNTLFDTGNAILCFNGKNSVVEYNHVYNGGLLCKDVSLVYTQQPTTYGSVVRYNWVHGCRTDSHTSRGGLGGLGIRGDDETRGLSVHHNVVWQCGRDGIIIKGDLNRAYNNTVFDIGAEGTLGNYVNLPTMPEPVKSWRNQGDLLESQNQNTRIFNNAARTITSSNNGAPYPTGANCSHNYQGETLGLVDIGGFDFRPATGSPLIDAGRAIPGITDGHHGTAPDIGAYEFGGPHWKPGADWGKP